MRSTLALLLLFGAVIGMAFNECPYPLDDFPTDAPCILRITTNIMGAGTDAEARAKCMSYCPTTFLTGKIISSKDSKNEPIPDRLDQIEVKCIIEKHEPCKLYEVPQEKPCQITINWKVRDAAQATAVCLEYFPTTFVKGKVLSSDRIRCTVQTAYKCVDPDTFLMFDKCYSFPKESTNPESYVEGTIKEYEELLVSGDPTKGRQLCNGGKLSVFYSHTHSKFLGMKANSLGINKLWIGITKDGYSIEEPNRKIHSEMWKLVQGDYWDLDQGKPVLKSTDPKKVPDAAKYYFMRTRNDQFNNRFQGSFERATDKIKATFACEFEAKITAYQKWYCDKMRTMGIDSQFDLVSDTKPRCLYASANLYTWKGDVPDMNNIKGCQEKPSDLHSAGLDDGTGAPKIYYAPKGPRRLAGHRAPHTLGPEGHYLVQNKCQSPVTDKHTRELLFMKWRHLEHKGKSKIAATTSLEWDKAYPKNECSDFPGESTTLGVKKDKMIDMPPEIRAQAICSIIFFQECENKNPCGNKLECTNSLTFQAVTYGEPKSGFFTCNCPAEGLAYEPSVVDGTKTCAWKGQSNCAWFNYASVRGGFSSEFVSVQNSFIYIGDYKDNRLEKAVVRDQCRLSVQVHKPEHFFYNYMLLNEAGYGTHEVPNYFAGTVGGELQGLGASSWKCTC